MMSQATDGTGVGRELVKVSGSSGNSAAPGRALGQRREEPQLADIGAGEVLFADVAGVGEHGAQLRPDPGFGQLLTAGVQQELSGFSFIQIGLRSLPADLPSTIRSSARLALCCFLRRLLSGLLFCSGLAACGGRITLGEMLGLGGGTSVAGGVCSWYRSAVEG